MIKIIRLLKISLLLFIPGLCDECTPGICTNSETCCDIPKIGPACCPTPNACCCPDYQHCCQMEDGEKTQCICTGTCPGESCACIGCRKTDGQCTNINSKTTVGYISTLTPSDTTPASTQMSSNANKLIFGILCLPIFIICVFL